MTDVTEADARCEVWDTNKMAKKAAAAENALWNSRLYTAPKLLQDPDVFDSLRGHWVSVEAGRLGVGLRDDRLFGWSDRQERADSRFA